jgi:hypothetical protein
VIVGDNQYLLGEVNRRKGKNVDHPYRITSADLYPRLDTRYGDMMSDHSICWRDLIQDHKSADLYSRGSDTNLLISIQIC